MDDQLMRDYLLGDSTESASEALEDLYLSDSEARERIEEAEADLLDLYVRGRLPEPRRSRVERRYLSSPPRRARLEFARALVAVVDAESGAARATTPGTGWRGLRRLLPLAAVVLVAIGTAAILVERAKLRDRVDRLEAEVAAQHSVAPPPPSATGARPGSASRGAYVLLLAPLTRGESMPRPVRWPEATEEIELRLLGDLGGYPRFQVTVATSEGARSWSGPGERVVLPQGEAVAARVPASRLPQGGYVATVQGVAVGSAPEDLHRYAFRVAAHAPTPPTR
jgi:hypothetical protein